MSSEENPLVHGAGSRFISQDAIDVARDRRNTQWKAAFERLGQEPPKAVEEPYDGRSLAEKLAANRAMKQEEFEEKTKLANQFRALEPDEVAYLDSIREKAMQAEKLRMEVEDTELKGFKEAVAARSVAPPPVISPTSSLPPPPPKATIPSAKKKDNKKSLKGVVVRKKSQPVAKVEDKAAPVDKKRDIEEVASDDTPDAKRQRTQA
ncbi:hypothetical protein CYLTODRAFT_426925 [Cylindrobasidium torrendii FP15055 ss-10]|uniref:FAM192A/Fyv6 N-terminal domain-containing protein n=1 Tax=Cylindrobasidium torrendii FP15055 ss-10 TaxID=1314674 RepID=A0A0D7AYT6_9AGAR|nr:hypothetical protein CYLTODRAFT_426925 [Cylindrobasidium torrendii FP15055 ss-10]